MKCHGLSSYVYIYIYITVYVHYSWIPQLFLALTSQCWSYWCCRSSNFILLMDIHGLRISMGSLQICVCVGCKMSVKQRFSCAIQSMTYLLAYWLPSFGLLGPQRTYAHRDTANQAVVKLSRTEIMRIWSDMLWFNLIKQSSTLPPLIAAAPGLFAVRCSFVGPGKRGPETPEPYDITSDHIHI